MLRFDIATHLSLPFKFILSVRLSNSLRCLVIGSGVFLLSEFLNVVLIFALYLELRSNYVVIHFSSDFFWSIQRIYGLSYFVQ